jgi:hypothetical protein
MVAAATESSSPALGFGTGLVYVQRAPAGLRAIQRRDGLLAIFVAGHFYKAEAARAAGVAVSQNTHAIDLPERLEQLPQIVFRCVEVQIAYENVFQASAPALSCRSSKLDAADWQVGETFLKIDTGAGEQSNAAKVYQVCQVGLSKSAHAAINTHLLARILRADTPSATAGSWDRAACRISGRLNNGAMPCRVGRDLLPRRRLSRNYRG